MHIDAVMQRGSDAVNKGRRSEIQAFLPLSGNWRSALRAIVDQCSAPQQDINAPYFIKIDIEKSEQTRENRKNRRSVLRFIIFLALCTPAQFTKLHQALRTY